MIAGTLGMLAEPVADPLEDYSDSGGRVCEVEASHTYLDGHRIQSGQIAGTVPVHEERVDTTGGEIDVEQRTTRKTVASEWVADVQQDGWILAERTWPTEEDHRPEWPFAAVEVLCGQDIVPMAFDPAAFADSQDDAVVEMTTIESANGTRINWDRDPGRSGTRANTGVALETQWGGQFVRLAMYASGYLAIWEPADWAPEKVGRFVHEEIIPVAEPAEQADETVQQEVSEA